MNVLVLSDIHGNAAALEAVLREPHDAVICLGDIVGYGPRPRGCVRMIRDTDASTVQGNHDRAAALGVEPGCRATFRWLAEAVTPLTRMQLDEDDQAYLADAPDRRTLEIDGVRYLAVHATPTEPLYRYRRADDPAWAPELAGADADALLVGHTHVQYQRVLAGKHIINPGSVGQPKDGDPRAAYAVIADGVVELKRAEYPVERTVAALEAADVSADAVKVLAALLRTGTVPQTKPG